MAALTLQAEAQYKQGSHVFSLALAYPLSVFHKLKRYSPFYVNKSFKKALSHGKLA